MNPAATNPSPLLAHRRTLQSCRPYLVASEAVRADLDLAPLGVAIAPEDSYCPWQVASAPFLTLLQRLDRLTFGPLGMEMPRWVFYDCAEMPGGILGLGRPAGELPVYVRQALGADSCSPDTLVPLSMYILIPTMEPGTWLGYTVCSINQVSPGGGPAGLRLLSKALALSSFRVGYLLASEQWRSPNLATHARFGPLELLTAFTPAHSVHATFTYRLRVTPERVEAALAPDGPSLPPPSAWLDADDEEAMRALQVRIEGGARVAVAGPPRIRGALTEIPLYELP